MNSLSTRLALLLAAAFVALGGVLIIGLREALDARQLPGLAGLLLFAALLYALFAAWCVRRLFTRRLQRLTEAVEALQQGNFSAALRLPGAARNGGDEIDRLAANMEMMSERISSQVADLERVAGRRRELLANVSHDLRTPLASMQGYLELLLLRHGTLAPDEERNYLETASRHSERLGRLVADLFDLAKLEADEVKLQPEDFPLAELAQDVAQKFALDARRREVQLRADCGDEMPVARVDIGMVERVLENLVENALRHTPPGGQVTIELGVAAQRVRMAVSDTGRGIAAEDLPSVFERYYRADRTGAGAGDHAGLGLAIARRIVQLHGGELVVHSTPGRGTRFAFDLPLTARVGPSDALADRAVA